MAALAASDDPAYRPAAFRRGQPRREVKRAEKRFARYEVNRSSLRQYRNWRRARHMRMRFFVSYLRPLLPTNSVKGQRTHTNA